MSTVVPGGADADADAGGEAGPRTGPAGAVALVNADVRTMDRGRPRATVVVVRDGRIAAVGDAGLERRHPDAAVVDLGGRTVTPGFIDAHHHLCLAALHPRWADLTGVADLDTVRQRLVELDRTEPDTPWLRAAGWDEPGTGLRLTRHDLDALGLSRPVLVACFSYHRGVVSTAGLDALGLSDASADPPGGHLARDETGHLTGLLVERAWTAAHAASLAGYDDPDRWGELIEARARTLLAQGITAVHDAACPPEAEAVYRSLSAGGRLPVSVLAMPHGAILAGPPDGRLADGPPTGEGDERFRIGAVKLFADGGIDIAIDAHLGDQHIVHGELFPDLEATMAAAVARGYGVAVHAMGNQGLRATLAAWRAATDRAVPSHPLRIEHVTLAGPAEVAAMAELGVAGVVQPGFVELIGRTIGNLRFDDATWLPFADLVASGMGLAASSDAPCHTTDPLALSRHGATRLTEGGREVGPDQAVPLGRWLELYTAGAADVGGQEGERGRLRAGLRADLVVLDGTLDERATGPDATLAVAETWVEGRPVWTASGPP